MSLDPALHARIDQLVHSNRAVLFMKGTRASPRCGFSAAAVAALDSVVPDYLTVDVLADEDVRQGIKVYGNWPTIPQLYVDGELVGGSDIIEGMLNSGELHRALGQPEPATVVPSIVISDAAAAAIKGALPADGSAVVHLSLDAAGRAQFALKPRAGHEIIGHANGIDIHLDRASAARADGLVIDWVETPRGAGLSVRRRDEPQPVAPLDVEALKVRIDRGSIRVVDVRPAADRARAPFAGALVFDESTQRELAALPKDTALAFICHHGNSSRSAAEHFRGLGFTDLYNVEGGIDAWSQIVDPAVPRY